MATSRDRGAARNRSASSGFIARVPGRRVLYGVLKLRAAHAVFYGQILDGLHVERDAVNLRQFRLQAANDRGSIVFALVPVRFQIRSRRVRCCAVVFAPSTPMNDDRFSTSLFFQNYFSQLLLALRHCVKRDIVRRL